MASGISQYGYLGVSLFFMISGFVIAYSAEGRAPLEFAAARFARLYPAHMAAVTLTFIVTLLFGAPVFSASLGQFLANLTMFAPRSVRNSWTGPIGRSCLKLIFYAWVFLLLALGFSTRRASASFCAGCCRLVNELLLGIKPLRFCF